MLQIHLKNKSSTVWELTTKLQKGSSEIDFLNATIISDNDLNTHDRTEDLFLISNQVKVCVNINHWNYFRAHTIYVVQ